MPEIVDPEVKDPVTDPEKEVKEEKPTLESISAANKELNDKLEKIIKQNSDKDSHISKLEGENSKLRETMQKVTTSIEGKTEKQKDAILDKAREKLVAKGYDASAVDSLLEVISEVSDQRANQRVVPLIMEAAEDLIESDPEIDKKFLKDNSEDINTEYNSYKAESSPRKIKANLKKACNAVKERLAEEARVKESPEDKKKREDMLKGGGAPPKGKDKKVVTEDIEFLDSIEKAGSKSGHFV